MVSTMGKMIINEINLTVLTVLIFIEMKSHPQSQRDGMILEKTFFSTQKPHRGDISSEKNPFPLSSTFTSSSSLCHFLTQKVTKNLFAEVLFQID
jgi:hypothetical protein